MMTDRTVSLKFRLFNIFAAIFMVAVMGALTGTSIFCWNWLRPSTDKLHSGIVIDIDLLGRQAQEDHTCNLTCLTKNVRNQGRSHMDDWEDCEGSLWCRHGTRKVLCKYCNHFRPVRGRGPN